MVELEGLSGPHQKLPGVSVHVQDTLCGYRLMATYRSEDYKGYRYVRLWKARTAAAEACEVLNAAHEREVASPASGTAA